jgi:hypothetical protein
MAGQKGVDSRFRGNDRIVVTSPQLRRGSVGGAATRTHP